MARIICFGDSNTYGYDPRSFLGDRYPASVRWTGLLGEIHDVADLGLNGREIPHREQEIADAVTLIGRHLPADALIIMLGTNDLLQGASPEETAGRMEGFLAALLPACPETKILLLAPPPIVPEEAGMDPALSRFSVRCRELYRAMAEKLGILFAEPVKRREDMAFDGVHLSEGGHAALAAAVQRVLEQIAAQG